MIYLQQQKIEKSDISNRHHFEASCCLDVDRVHKKAVKRLQSELKVSYVVILSWLIGYISESFAVYSSTVLLVINCRLSSRLWIKIYLTWYLHVTYGPVYTLCPRKKGAGSILAETSTNSDNFSQFLAQIIWSLCDWKIVKCRINTCTTLRNDDVIVTSLKNAVFCKPCPGKKGTNSALDITLTNLNI